MSRRQKNPLRPLSTEEYRSLSLISRSTSEPAGHVVRARQLLAVAAGASYMEAARVSGRKSNDAVAHLVARFNREGLKAVEPKKGSGAPPTYGAAERERILREARRVPNPETDGTAKHVADDAATCFAASKRWFAASQHLHDSCSSKGCRLRLAANAHLV